MTELLLIVATLLCAALGAYSFIAAAECQFGESRKFAIWLSLTCVFMIMTFSFLAWIASLGTAPGTCADF